MKLKNPELLNRYTPEQTKVIEDYWEAIRWTRKYGIISPAVKERELVYWERFAPPVVVEALKIHIAKYPKNKETYTRGIMRNIADAWADGGGASASTPRPEAKETRKMRTSKFVNCDEHERDFEALSYLEELRNSGELEARRDELAKDPRYAPYLAGTGVRK